MAEQTTELTAEQIAEVEARRKEQAKAAWQNVNEVARVVLKENTQCGKSVCRPDKSRSVQSASRIVAVYREHSLSCTTASQV